MNNNISNIEFNPSGYTANGESSVLLLFQSGQDQRLFKQFLPEYLTVRFDPENVDHTEFDLCIVDIPSVYQNQDWLKKAKEMVAPIFLPVLLLSEDQEAIRQNEMMLEFADDVVYIPASSKVLKSRIQLLLKQRDYSLKLEEKNRELEEKNKELIEEKRKFQLLADNSTDMISCHSPDGTYLYASPASEELIDYTPKELIGEDVFENMHPDDTKRLQDEVKDFEDGKIERWEFRKLTKEGTYKWVESALRPIGDEETGEITEIQASTRDITQRKKYELELEKSREQWSKLVKNNPNLIQILDPAGKILFINKSGADFLGYENPKTLHGKNYFDLIEMDEEQWDLTEARLKKVLEGQKVRAQIYQIKRLDGEMRCIESHAMPITLDDGRLGVQQVAQDVTEVMKSEKNLKDSLEEKEILLQEIHHRVKNNLAVVSGMMDLQAFSSENLEVKRLLTDSKNRIKTMALIHEKLYQSSSLSQIDFGSYVEDLLNNIKGVSEIDQKIDLELNYDSFNLNVNQAVPTALVINEVVANAFEHAFIDQESGLIKVTLKNNDDKIVISVQDNGRGLPDDFEFRKSQSLGITIIETLIQQLEAEQSIENKNGLSFTFSFKKKEIKGSSSTLV